ncbi:hypothetical protein E2320_006372 [Naja naja]|nr:hypothetical protein E2320_006372 [Naja naja]
MKLSPPFRRREGRAPTEPPPSETAASGRVATAGKRRRGRGGRLGCFRWRPMDGQIGGGCNWTAVATCGGPRKGLHCSSWPPN